MNNEFVSSYQTDKQERIKQPKANTVEYKAMRAQDLERRERVKEMAVNELHAAEDYDYAAHIVNHGDASE